MGFGHWGLGIGACRLEIEDLGSEARIKTWIVDREMGIDNWEIDGMEGWMDRMDGWIGWMDRMDGSDGWMDRMDESDGWIGWMEPMDGPDGCMG